MWQERTIPLKWFDQIRWEEEKVGERKKERKKERRIRRREKLHFLSRFPDDWTVDSGQSKRRSWSTHRELRVGTKISGFRQTPRGRGFSHTWFNYCLRAIQIVESVKAGTTLHFSPKDLGLNAGFFGSVFEQQKLNFRDCFKTVRNEFMDCFLVVQR